MVLFFIKEIVIIMSYSHHLMLLDTNIFIFNIKYILLKMFS